MTTLRSGKGELILVPESGGCVSAFRWNGVDILRPFEPAKGSGAPATEYAAFPLFPFSGRIAHGQFRFDGIEHTLPANFQPEPHAIHGQGWQASWKVTSITDTSIEISYAHDGSIWPWAYKAIQTFSIFEHGLCIELSLSNEGPTQMPAGIGWHPYFPATGAKLVSDVTCVWLSPEDMIPGSPSSLTSETDLTSSRNVADLNLDNAFSAGSTGTRIWWPARGNSIEMTATDLLRHLIVYTPPGEDFFCVEPVSHSPDAVNSPEPMNVTGLKILQPGETIAGTITLKIET